MLHDKLHKMVKLRIAPRLFAAVLLSLAVAGAAGIVLVRWSLFAAGATTSETIEPDDGQLVQALETSYRRRGSWGFLPTDADARGRWLGKFWIGQLRTDHAGPLVIDTGTYGDRIALVDTTGQVLSGAVPGRILQAVGSIDTRRIPLIVGDRTVGYLVIAGAGNAEDKLSVAFLLQKQRQLMLIAALGLVLAVAMAALLAAHFRRPIVKLRNGARLLERGRFDARLDENRSDELGELACTFNHLAARLEGAELTRRHWVANTSHELRTPLAVLRAQIESLQDGIRPPTAQNLDLMLTHVETLTRRVDDLYELARADSAELHYKKQPVSIWPLIQTIVAGFHDRVTSAGLAISIDPEPPQSRVLCDSDRMRQVLVNLLENAVRYTDTGGQIRVTARSDGKSLIVTVDDTVPGVPAASLIRLGERFFRTERARASGSGGAGLGLALSRQIVEAHDGALDFLASDMGGLRAKITLPLIVVA